MNEDFSQNTGPGNGAPQPPSWNQPPQNPPPPPPGGYYMPPKPPANGKSRWWIWPVALGGGCLFWLILGLIAIIMIPFAASVGSGKPSGKHVALIHVSGIITAGRGNAGLFGSSAIGSEDIIAQLERARKSSGAKAIVLRINSPGGSAAGSEEVYNEIKRIRSDGKPVYISMGDMAASGGYYISAPADRIYADASTITGSIGVIFETTDLSSLYKKIGLNPEVVKSGKFKDIGSPNRPLTPEERTLLKGVVDSTYEKFLSAVSDGRGIPVAKLRPIADGRIFTGEQAKKLKLVDRIGGLHDTIRAAARAGHIKGEPSVHEYKRTGFFDQVLGSESERFSGDAERIVGKEVIDRFLHETESSPRLR